MTTEATPDDDFAQFEDDDATPQAPAKPAKKAARKAPAKKATARKSAPRKSTPKKAEQPTSPEPPSEGQRDDAADEAAHDARVAEATSDEDTIEITVEKTIEVTEPVVKDGMPQIKDGKVVERTVERTVTFTTKVPSNIGEWDGRVMRRFGQGRDEEGLIFLLGDTEFDRYLDIMAPKHKDVAPPLMSALMKALGLRPDSGN